MVLTTPQRKMQQLLERARSWEESAKAATAQGHALQYEAWARRDHQKAAEIKRWLDKPPHRRGPLPPACFM